MSNTNTRIWSDTAIPPGTYLGEELAARDMSQKELAERMGRPPQVINEIIKGKKAITEETALELERVLSTPAQVWANLETNYQMTLARFAENDDLEKQLHWLRRFPVRAMERRSWIDVGETDAEKVRELLMFFGVASFDAWRERQAALGFRTSAGAKIDEHALAAWVRKGEIEGREAETAEYDQQRFTDVLTEIRSLTTESPERFWPKVERLCASAGVAARVVQEFPKTGANGVARWLTGSKALIQLNLRYNWADIFWFSFFHEAKHILSHEQRRVFVDLKGAVRRVDDKELEADEFASDFLIPRDQWAPFVAANPQRFDEVSRFAQEVGIHPGIVVGRLQYEKVVGWQTGLSSLKERFRWEDDA